MNPSTFGRLNFEQNATDQQPVTCSPEVGPPIARKFSDRFSWTQWGIGHETVVGQRQPPRAETTVAPEARRRRYGSCCRKGSRPGRAAEAQMAGRAPDIRMARRSALNCIAGKVPHRQASPATRHRRPCGRSLPVTRRTLARHYAIVCGQIVRTSTFYIRLCWLIEVSDSTLPRRQAMRRIFAGTSGRRESTPRPSGRHCAARQPHGGFRRSSANLQDPLMAITVDNPPRSRATRRPAPTGN